MLFEKKSFQISVNIFQLEKSCVYIHLHLANLFQNKKKNFLLKICEQSFLNLKDLIEVN